MDTDMIHESIGAKIAVIAIKDASYFFAYYLFFPCYDFVILQVQQFTFLDPFVIGILNDIKSILGVLIAFVILIKVISGTVKNFKEIKALKKDSK